MTQYQQYAEYKDSGVEWLGEIPSHWGVTRLKWCLTNNDGGVWGDDPQGFDDTIVLRSTEQTVDGHWKINDPAIRKLNKYEKASALLVAEDLLLTKSSGSTLHIGKTTLVTKEVSDLVCCYSNFMQRLRVNKKLSAKLVWYLLNNNLARTQFEYLSNTTTGLANLNSSIIGEIILPLAVIEEQIQIANFLDHETAKINTLIAKQEKLIQLLKEKRQAVISYAVTKGLNPNVPMKDSGVGWLGEVPEHWVVSLIKYQCKEVTDGAHISPELESGEHLFVSIRDIKDGVINFEDALLTSTKSYQYLLHTGCQPKAGDILFSKDGTIGQTAITPLNVDFVVASSLIIIRPNLNKVISGFLDLLLQSDIVQEQVESFVKGAALRRLSIQNLLKIWGVFPSLEEQKIIVDFVLSQIDKYRALEDRAEKQVQLLIERRTALISAAVTGKIDVRNWQNPTEAKREFSA